MFACFRVPYAMVAGIMLIMISIILLSVATVSGFYKKYCWSDSELLVAQFDAFDKKVL